MEKTDPKIIETVKGKVKNYYADKNMTVRYVILWFFVIFLIVQFILPHKKSKVDSMDSIVENLWLEDEDSDIFSFLWSEIDATKFQPTESVDLSKAIKSIEKDISYTYSMSQYHLTQIQDIFLSQKVPVDFSYIAILWDFELPYRSLDEKLRNDYWLTISREVDERLNVSKSSQAFAQYLTSLYKKYWDWRLVLVAYFMWTDKLDEQIKQQWEKSFDNIYFQKSILDNYYKIMWYSYAFQNMDQFTNVQKLISYKPLDTKTVSVSETKNLIKWCRKNKYSYKEIKQLNPRILWNSLPKWKREIVVSH